MGLMGEYPYGLPNRQSCCCVEYVTRLPDPYTLPGPAFAVVPV